VDLVTLVVTALAAGASSGVTGAAGEAVGEAYQGLKGLVRRCLAAVGHDPAVVDAAGDPPEATAWRAQLGDVLTPAAIDDDLRAAAEQVLGLADPAGFRAGRYSVDLRGAKGVQLGDGNTQHNSF
jgi:hypothetical protein